MPGRPFMFNAVGERIMREVEERLEERPGKVIGGRCVWNIRYADDMSMVAKSREECSVMGETLRSGSKEVGLDINMNTISVMTVHGKGEIEIGGKKIQNVEKVKLLGSYTHVLHLEEAVLLTSRAGLDKQKQLL